jgi:hypothetical protein
MTLRANESAMKEEAKGISRRKHKNLGFRFLLIVALVSITMGSFFIACNSDDMFSKSIEFLDLDISALSSEIQESDRLIIEAAKDRIEPYVTYENGQYEISIKNGKQIQISDRLFHVFINAIESNNQSLKELKSNTEVVIVQDTEDKKILHIIELKNSVRLKSGNESPIPLGSSGTDWRWYGWDLYLTNKDANDFAYIMSNVSDASYTIALATARYKMYGITVVAGAEGIWFSNIAKRVSYYNGPNGVIIRYYAGIPFVYTR